MRPRSWKLAACDSAFSLMPLRCFTPTETRSQRNRIASSLATAVAARDGRRSALATATTSIASEIRSTRRVAVCARCCETRESSQPHPSSNWSAMASGSMLSMRPGISTHTAMTATSSLCWRQATPIITFRPPAGSGRRVQAMTGRMALAARSATRDSSAEAARPDGHAAAVRRPSAVARSTNPRRAPAMVAHWRPSHVVKNTASESVSSWFSHAPATPAAGARVVSAGTAMFPSRISLGSKQRRRNRRH